MVKKLLSIVGLAGLFAGKTEGLIVHRTTPFDVPLDATQDKVWLSHWDFDGDGTNDFRFRNDVTESGTWGTISGDGNASILQTSTGASARMSFSLGKAILTSPIGGTFQNGKIYLGYFYGGNWNGNAFQTESGYFIFKNGNHIGWAKMTISPSSTKSERRIVINEWAYQSISDQTPFIIGQVPEPTTSSLALLSLGVAGLRRWRKK